MSRFIKITSSADDRFEFDAWHADPLGTRRGGVIVVQEIFGIDDYIRADVERWSQNGFEVLGPSMYDRIETRFRAPHDEAGTARAMAVVRQAKFKDALADIAACIDYLKSRGPVFAVGYCYGGTVVWHAAARLNGLAAVSSYYGGGIEAAADLIPKCPVICHFGRRDPHIHAANVYSKLSSIRPEVIVYIYENSGHGFNNEGTESADIADTKRARERTVALFEANGG